MSSHYQARQHLFVIIRYLAFTITALFLLFLASCNQQVHVSPTPAASPMTVTTTATAPITATTAQRSTPTPKPARTPRSTAPPAPRTATRLPPSATVWLSTTTALPTTPTLIDVSTPTAGLTATLSLGATSQPTSTTRPTSGMMVAVGSGHDQISVLTEAGWVKPVVQDTLLGCAGSGSVVFDRRGNPWVGCFSTVHSTDGGKTWKQPVASARLPIGGDKIVRDPQGRIWFIERRTLTLLDPQNGRVIRTYSAAETTGEMGFPTNAAIFDQAGKLWLGGANFGGSLLVSFDGKEWQTYSLTETFGLTTRESPKVLFVTSAGNLLITIGSVIYTLNNNALEPFIPANSLARYPVPNALLETPDGHLWIATSVGILVWDGSSLAHIGTADGLPSENVRALALDDAGRVWVGTAYGIAVQDGNGGWQVALPGRSGLTDSRFVALAVRGTPELPPSTSVTQTVTISGRIVFLATPVPNTQVELCGELVAGVAQVSPCAGQLFSVTTQTDSDGRFTFEHVPLGVLSLAAITPDGLWRVALTNIPALDANEEISLGNVELGH